MKLAVIGANGKAGKLIVKEAVNRGLDVTAVVRGDNTTVAQEVLKKDLFDLTAADLKGFDVVIDAFGAWTEETLPQHSTSLKHLCDILSGTDTRLIVVGGAGSLYAWLTARTSQTSSSPSPQQWQRLWASFVRAGMSSGLISALPVISGQTVRAPASTSSAARN